MQQNRCLCVEGDYFFFYFFLKRGGGGGNACIKSLCNMIEISKLKWLYIYYCLISLSIFLVPQEFLSFSLICLMYFSKYLFDVHLICHSHVFQLYACRNLY